MYSYPYYCMKMNDLSLCLPSQVYHLNNHFSVISNQAVGFQQLFMEQTKQQNLWSLVKHLLPHFYFWRQGYSLCFVFTLYYEYTYFFEYPNLANLIRIFKHFYIDVEYNFWMLMGLDFIDKNDFAGKTD